MLLRGGLRAAEEADVAGVVDMEATGEGVDVSDISGFASSFSMLASTAVASSGFSPHRLESRSMECTTVWLG